MKRYRVEIYVEKIDGYCPIYKVGDKIIVDSYFINSKKSANVCIHAFGAMMTLLSAFSHGTSARKLGIGSEDDVGFLQCPDPGPPLTSGGTVTFKLIRKVINNEAAKDKDKD
ncbi:MAG: TIGR04076 family protein [Candidatus Asgardarchaeia archaeon]